MNDLKSKIDYYNDLVARALATDDTTVLSEIRSLNRTITSLLNEEIQRLTFLRKESSDVSQERNRLIERLRQIQKDYNGLRETTDTLETLRRIREEESSEGKRVFALYMAGFLGICLLVLFYLVFFPQAKATTSTMAITPPKMPTLV